jgi:hypothetical protein
MSNGLFYKPCSMQHMMLLGIPACAASKQHWHLQCVMYLP